MKNEIRNWRHIFKLDPDRPISDDAVEALCSSGTDAIMVGGTSGITFENTLDMLARIQRCAIPRLLEVSHLDAIVPGFDLYLIPSVLNTTRVEWLIGQQHHAIKHFGAILPWDRMACEAYIILNGESTAGRMTEARTDLDEEDVVAYAQLAEQMFHMPIVYVEYSGRFGDMKLARAVRETLRDSRCFYGGGIDSLEKARLAAQAADTIVVGNVIYTDLQQALETVKVKDDQL